MALDEVSLKNTDICMQGKRRGEMNIINEVCVSPWGIEPVT